jgi:hypothetical protein
MLRFAGDLAPTDLIGPYAGDVEPGRASRASTGLSRRLNPGRISVSGMPGSSIAGDAFEVAVLAHIGHGRQDLRKMTVPGTQQGMLQDEPMLRLGASPVRRAPAKKGSDPF